MTQSLWKPRNCRYQGIFAVLQQLSKSVATLWLYNEIHKVLNRHQFFLLFYTTQVWEKKNAYICCGCCCYCYNCFFSCKGSFLIYLHPACFMNIQLLMELQANIHGNELINSILLAPSWFMKYTEVLIIFPILYSSWFLKHNGIIDNSCYPRFSQLFFLIFLKQRLSDI